MEIQSASVRSAILALYTMNFLTSSGFGVLGVIVPLYIRDLGLSFVNLLGNIGSTIGFLGIGIILDTGGFVYPFVIRTMTYIVVAILIYFKLTD